MLFTRFFNKLSRIRHASSRAYCDSSISDVTFEDIPVVTPSAIKQTFRSHNIGFEEGYTCFITTCPNCAQKTKTPASTLYINKNSGYTSCVSCLATSQWENYANYITAKFSKSRKRIVAQYICNTYNLEKLNEYIKSIETSTTLLSNITDQSEPISWAKFGIPIPVSDIQNRIELRIDPIHSTLYFPLQTVESQIVGYKVMKRKKTVTEPDEFCLGILRAKSMKGKDVKDTAVLVAEIKDFITLINAGISMNIVCLPNGLKNLPQHILPSLEKYHKLVLWIGSDIDSWDSARSFSKKLGEKRCLFIRPTEENPLPHLAELQNIKRIIASAQPILHKSITTFASLREDVLSNLQNIDKEQGVKWKRYPTLTRILKGHRRGELTVITGPTGCGKTTFMSEYSLDLAMQGVNTLWGSFEIRNARLAKTMLQQMVGLPLEDHLAKFNDFANEFEKMPIYFMTFHGQQSIKVVMEAIEHAQYVNDIAHVIIDNLQFMMGVSDSERHMDRFSRQDAIIAAFRTFATRRHCHVSLVIHPRKERDDEDLAVSSIFGGAKAAQEADNILIIQDKRLVTVKGKKMLQVAKNRYSGDIGIMTLDFNKAGLSYAQKKRKAPVTPKECDETKGEEVSQSEELETTTSKLDNE